MYKRILMIITICAFIMLADIEASADNKGISKYTIAQDGTGDFTTIQEGVDAASDGDTIIVYPGVYTEEVQVMNKDISITGIDKDTCILRYDTALYIKAPLTIASGSVSNLTIYGMNSGIEAPELTQEEIADINSKLEGDSWDRQKNYKGYAVHIDQNCLYEKSLSLVNCRIISDNNHCVGIGTRGNSTISFENCELISQGLGSCIFLHDPTSPDVSGETSFIMKNCSLTSSMCPYVMTFQSLLPQYNVIYLTFQNVSVSAVAYAAGDSYMPYNVNTGPDLETLIKLQDEGVLCTSAPKLVHEMPQEEINAYMDYLNKRLELGNPLMEINTLLPEGITYIGKYGDNGKDRAKRQVIAVYNTDNQVGNGWCGLYNAFLTQDSFGNTLPEMNTSYVDIPTIQHTQQSAFSANCETGH